MSEKKTWQEIYVMPITIAFVGITGSFIISCYETYNAEKIAQSRIDAAKEQTDREHSMKMLELIVPNLFKDDTETIKKAIQLLEVVYVGQAKKIANSIIENATNIEIIDTAKKVAYQIELGSYLRQIRQQPNRGELFDQAAQSIGGAFLQEYQNQVQKLNNTTTFENDIISDLAFTNTIEKLNVQQNAQLIGQIKQALDTALQ